MLNPCSNSLILYGPREVLDVFVEARLSLRELLPWPAELNRMVKDNKLQENWAANRWGTRQDIGPLKDLTVQGPLGHDGHYELKAEFKSAWGPPVRAFESLYERYKSRGLEVWLEYIEPECQFMGVVTTRAGEFVDEQRGYDTADELEQYSRELDHGLGTREASYLRLVEVEEKAAKKGKKAATPKAKPVPKAPPPKVESKPAPKQDKPVPTGLTGTLDSLIREAPAKAEPAVQITTTPPPTKPVVLRAKPPVEPPTVASQWTVEKKVARKPVPPAPKVPPVDEPTLNRAIEFSKLVKAKLDAMPRLKIDAMMKPKGQRPPAPKIVTTEKARVAEETPMKVPTKSSAPTPKAATPAKVAEKPAPTKKPAAKTSPKPAASKAVKAAAKPAATKKAAPKPAAKAAPAKPAAPKATPAKKPAAAPKAAAPVKPAPAKKAAAPKQPAVPASKDAKSTKAPKKK